MIKSLAGTCRVLSVAAFIGLIVAVFEFRDEATTIACAIVLGSSLISLALLHK